MLVKDGVQIKVTSTGNSFKVGAVTPMMRAYMNAPRLRKALTDTLGSLVVVLVANAPGRTAEEKLAWVDGLEEIKFARKMLEITQER